MGCGCRFSQDELLAIDLEGRCVITDHGHFILFNLYGPAITNEESAEERFAYKLRLYKVTCPPCAQLFASMHPFLHVKVVKSQLPSLLHCVNNAGVCCSLRCTLDRQNYTAIACLAFTASLPLTSHT